MSDSNDGQSVRLGARFLEAIGVGPGHVRPDQDGVSLENRVIDRLREVRPDLVVKRSCAASEFSQYQHLNVFPAFRTSYSNSTAAMNELENAIQALHDRDQRDRLIGLAARVSDGISANAELVDALKSQMPEESLLNIDVAVGVPQDDGRIDMAVALSAKWSLRTDRAQDCVSQGNKLVAQRRGRMPHFGVITVETRPSMLRILADGSGSVDWVYHLDLAALTKAIDAEAQQQRNPGTWSPKRTFDRLLNQGRLRDFDDLVRMVEQLPTVRQTPYTENDVGRRSGSIGTMTAKEPRV